MILCGMADLCRLVVALVIDLFRPRAALEAEILVLRACLRSSTSLKIQLVSCYL
jgi:hypothetical protein